MLYDEDFLFRVTVVVGGGGDKEVLDCPVYLAIDDVLGCAGEVLFLVVVYARSVDCYILFFRMRCNFACCDVSTC